MAQQNINVGSNPNDGTGDSLRAAFVKVQNNFSEFYSTLSPVLTSNNVALANTLVSGTGNTLSINSTVIVVPSISVGTANVAANGYVHLSANLIMSWGTVLANSTVSVVTFPIAFTVNCFNVQATSNSTAAFPVVTTINSSAFSLQTNSAVSETVQWSAIGI